MKRENLAFFVAGLVFGILIGYGLFDALTGPKQGAPAALQSAASQPAPPAPVPARLTASMMEEVERLRGVLNRDPRNIAALTRMANLYHDAGMWQSAVDWYRKALAVQPDGAGNLTDLGICLRRLGKPGEALDAFRKALAIQPNQWQALYNQVVVEAYDLHHFEEALQALDRLAEVRPDLPNLDQLRSRIEHERSHPSGG